MMQSTISGPMTSTAITAALSMPPITQITNQNTGDKSKRVSTKNVSWETGDKLCQVRLFAAEDAPSLSSTVLQDQLQAKKTKFMHAVIPVSVDDLPPGFEGVAAKRARLDAEAILAMVTEVTWRPPERFFNDPSWMVASGDGSAEVFVQLEREVRVLEAVYPRPSVIPPSPIELQDTLSGSQDSEIPQVPLIPLEDEEDGGSEEDPATGAVDKSGIEASLNDGRSLSLKNVQNFGPRVQSGGSSGAPVVMDPNNSNAAGEFLKRADPDVAAAAAAAYAVIKAKENGALIDHDLLIKILSNPVLIETLVASNPALKHQIGNFPNSTEASNGGGPKASIKPSIGGGIMGMQVPQPRQGLELPPEAKLNPGPHGMLQGGPIAQSWDANSSGCWPASQGRMFNIMGNQEQMLNGARGIPGPFKAMYGQPVRPHQDLAKELIQQHGAPGGVTEPHLKHIVPLGYGELGPGQDIERHPASGMTSRSQPWIGSNQTAQPAYSRNQPAPHNRPATKTNKLCLYYNSPRGCRKGLNCDFVHETDSK